MYKPEGEQLFMSYNVTLADNQSYLVRILIESRRAKPEEFSIDEIAVQVGSHFEPITGTDATWMGAKEAVQWVRASEYFWDANEKEEWSDWVESRLDRI